MAEASANRNHIRTQETIQKLLAAAEEVFVRDGYDGAQLGEIAATAGRSKGALYGHFRSKEELFLTLLENRTQHYIGKLKQKLESCPNPRQLWRAFRQFYVELVNDKTWAILTLEFKLYCLRHPNARKQLQKSLKQTLPGSDGDLFFRIFETLPPLERAAIDRALLALRSLVSGLILESYFYPEDLSIPAIQELLGRLFDALLPHDKSG